MHFLGHFRTVTRHRHKVMEHCFKAGIPWQGLRHDLSKFSPTEFWAGVKYWQGTRSPNERERELYGYSAAWLHHKGRNKHHFEYWKDVSPISRRYEPVKMPIRYMAEMFCDRVAASKIYQGDNYTDQHPLTYFRRGNARLEMHPKSAELLEEWLVMLAEQGEEMVFAEIRKVVRASKKKENK